MNDEKKLLRKLNELGIRNPSQLAENDIIYWWQKKFKEIKKNNLENQKELLININNAKEELENIDKTDLIKILRPNIAQEDFEDNSTKNKNVSNFPFQVDDLRSQGDDLRYNLKIDFKDAIFGQQRLIKIPQLAKCEVCMGIGATQGNGQVIADPCKCCSGYGVTQVRKKLRINIPAGVDTGTKLRVSGEGNVGLKGESPGDLYIFLFVENDSNFKRDGITIFSEISISNSQATLGDTIKINTIDGMVNLKIPRGTKTNTTFSLKGKGVPQLGNPTNRGNHQVIVNVAE